MTTDITPTIKTRHTSTPFASGIGALKKQTLHRPTSPGGVIRIKDGSAQGRIVSAEHIGDDEAYVKVYTRHISEWMDMTKSAQRVMVAVFQAMQKERELDLIHLPLEAITTLGLTRTHAYKGLNELIRLRVIASADQVHWYYINPRFVYNGSRLSLIHGVMRKPRHYKKSKELGGGA